MFKIQQKLHTGKWVDLRLAPKFATEAEAWKSIAGLDPDGLVDKKMFRVVPTGPNKEAL